MAVFKIIRHLDIQQIADKAGTDYNTAWASVLRDQRSDSIAYSLKEVREVQDSMVEELKFELEQESAIS